MDDFHLGDRVEWLTQRRLTIDGGETYRAGIIIDLLDYEGSRRGVVGVLFDNPREMQSIPAIECRLATRPNWEDEYDWDPDRLGFPPSDVY